MKHKFLFALLAIILCLQTSCKKEREENDCLAFKNALGTNDISGVRQVVTTYINNLPSRFYTSENLSKLAGEIQSNCSITASVLCFDCIQTLPSQTEVLLSFTQNGSTVRKIIDISYSLQTNLMVFHNMHD